jgi:hypothetical protein
VHLLALSKPELSTWSYCLRIIHFSLPHLNEFTVSRAPLFYRAGFEPCFSGCTSYSGRNVHDSFIEPARDVVQAFDAMPWLTRTRRVRESRAGKNMAVGRLIYLNAPNNCSPPESCAVR